MSYKLLSIVTISFNQAQFLRETLDSVLSQKGEDIEYIVVDPGSTDGSREILGEYDTSIDHLVLEPDSGPADGLNKGFAKASGLYGYFLNSDDFLLPGAIDLMRSLWRCHTGADVLLGGAWMVSSDRKSRREIQPSPVTLDKLLSGESRVVQQGMSFCMDLFHKVGGFNVENGTCWDYELLCDFLAAGANTVLTKERLAGFRIHKASISGGVGGMVATNRYLADLDRIYGRFDRPKDAAGKRPRLNRLIRLLRSPSQGLFRAREILAPWTVQHRWKADLERKPIKDI